jgi:hypothetical protein
MPHLGLLGWTITTIVYTFVAFGVLVLVEWVEQVTKHGEW